MNNYISIIFLTLIKMIGMIFVTSQVAIGFMGVANYTEAYIAVLLSILAIPFGVFLPIVIASFFGAKDVLHWHWMLSLIFSSSGLILVFPGYFGLPSMSGFKGKSFKLFKRVN